MPAAQGWGSRMSTINNSYNQVGNFATADEAICRSLVFGGVPMRFPNLRFAFQEGGVAWAAHCSPALSATGRSATSTPSSITTRPSFDFDLLRGLFERHARGRTAQQIDRLGDGLAMLSDRDELPGDVDQFGESPVALGAGNRGRCSAPASSSAARPTTR